MDCPAEDIHKEFTTFKSFAKMWLETDGVPDLRQYILILQLLGKEGLCYWESFPLATPNNNDKIKTDHIWEAFMGSFKNITSFRSHREQTTNDFCNSISTTPPTHSFGTLQNQPKCGSLSNPPENYWH